MKRTPAVAAPGLHEYRRLLHELEVHKVELEMQNQALREDREQLEHSRARYADLYDRAPVGHLTIDDSGVIEELNLSCAALLGQERRFLHGKRLSAFIAAEGRGRLRDHIRACFESTAPLTLELSVPSPEGGLRPVELVSVPSAHTTGAPARAFHSVMTDLSARKREADDREQLLHRERQARLLAERVNRAKEDFLAVVSHELRTPLVPMVMWTKALRAGGLNDALRLRAVDAIDACVQVQVAMIDDLVDVARGIHGKLQVQRQAVDLQRILAAALEASAPSIAAKQVSLDVQLDAAPAWVTGDAVRLRQVLGNLLSNAVKFTREAGHIGVELHTRGDDVVLTVRDDGEGIDGAFLPEIFEPFRQHAGGTDRHHGGLGLGLTIVRQLVEQHGGTVTAESAGLGRGSRFTVTLPRRQEVPEAAAPVPRTETAPPRRLAGVQVLVIEDHGATREALQVALQTEGAATTTTASAAEARKALERSRPHVVVSDIGMPGEDGYQFIRRLRESETKRRRKRLPAVALTAHMTKADRRRALEAGFDGHVAKPIDFDRLVSEIGALSRARR